MHKKQKNETKKILGPIAVKILFFMVGLFISVAVAGVYAAWSNHVFPGDTITANGWNEVVDKLVEIDANTTAINARLNSCKVCIDCDADAGNIDGLEQCVGVGGGWSDWTGDNLKDDHPNYDNARCRIKMTCL